MLSDTGMSLQSLDDRGLCTGQNFAPRGGCGFAKSILLLTHSRWLCASAFGSLRFDLALPRSPLGAKFCPVQRIEAPKVAKSKLTKIVLNEICFVFSLGLFMFLEDFNQCCSVKPYPIGFSIPEEKIVKQIPVKERDFARINTFDKCGYFFEYEEDYYADYQRSFFAITRKKAGWDCMRHYEILANGCIPYFLDLELSGPDTLTFFPKKLVLEAMNLRGVSPGSIDHAKFNRAKYDQLLMELLAHTREHLTTKSMANYILKKMNYTGKGKVLFLAPERSYDYLLSLTIGGLKSVLGSQVIDFPRAHHIYKNYSEDARRLYGRGFSYTKIVEDIPVDRERIAERIQAREFELVIYTPIHEVMHFHDLVLKHYQVQEIAYLCGADHHRDDLGLYGPEYRPGRCSFWGKPNLFLREMDEPRPSDLGL